MKGFIEVTTTDAELRLININWILEVHPKEDGGSFIDYFRGAENSRGYINSSLSYEEIKQLIYEASK